MFWDFRITMTSEGIPGLLHIAADWKIMLMFIKNLKPVLLIFIGLLKAGRSDRTEEKPDSQRDSRQGMDL